MRRATENDAVSDLCPVNPDSSNGAPRDRPQATGRGRTHTAGKRAQYSEAARAGRGPFVGV